MNTMEKICEQVTKLQEVNEDLIDILTAAGRDSETQYTEAYLSMLEDMKALRKGLGVLLDEHSDVITDVEYEAEPVRMETIPKTDLIEFTEKFFRTIG